MILGDHILYRSDFFRTYFKVPEYSVDTVVTDPPYGCLKRVQSWDNTKIDYHALAWIFDQLLTPTGQIAIFSTDRLQPIVQNAFSRYFEFRYRETLLKPSAIVKHKDRPKPDTEAVLVFHRRGAKKIDRIYNWKEVADEGDPYERINRNRSHSTLGGKKRPVDVNITGLRHPSSVVLAPNRPAMDQAEKAGVDHSCQKSLAHVERLILLLSIEGQTILDPFTGSATTIVAAHRSGRRSIGFEINYRFFDQGKRRVERELKEAHETLTF